MLIPVRNTHRDIVDLSGFWKFKIDETEKGEREKWFKGFSSAIEVAVPGSWNEQLEEMGLLYYTGSAWYMSSVYIPEYYIDKKIWLRVGSADYHSTVWINGKKVGEDRFGFLPSHYDITEAVTPGSDATIVIKVNNELNQSTIPQGISPEHYKKEGRIREETFPATRFDFSPMGGIHRNILLFTTPNNFVTGIKVESKKNGKKSASVTVSIELNSKMSVDIRAVIKGKNTQVVSTVRCEGSLTSFSMKLPNCHFWNPDDPNMYDLEVGLIQEGVETDRYSLPIGIREIAIKKNKLLINGKEVFLKGFGKHEDFWASGKGLFLPLVVKDFNLLKWINANSFRTSHYPYADEIMDFADRNGILVIDEVPAVSIDTRYVNAQTRKNHKESIRRLFERDFNHPSVIMWAIGNEPNLVGAESYFNGRGRKYWKEMFDYARLLDQSRPITVPNCQRAGIRDPVLEFSDILTINRYYGWYENPGQISKAVRLMEEEMDLIYKKYKKPVFVTEFGADTMIGLHSTSDQMFTEEYQSKLLEAYIKLIESKPYTIGEHVWNFADFRTPQHFRRVVMNLKGVFTRNREPKLAAFTLKNLWKK